MSKHSIAIIRFGATKLCDGVLIEITLTKTGRYTKSILVVNKRWLFRKCFQILIYAYQISRTAPWITRYAKYMFKHSIAVIRFGATKLCDGVLIEIILTKTGRYIKSNLVVNKRWLFIQGWAGSRGGQYGKAIEPGRGSFPTPPPPKKKQNATACRRSIFTTHTFWLVNFVKLRQNKESETSRSCGMFCWSSQKSSSKHQLNFGKQYCEISFSTVICYAVE